ncbi:MAG TPA: hypothetical protein ENJ79_07335 [Gammaproteobacteria bacterium]|nr:hypothetical protein [Gammaproteobacteria bacterium]
MVEAGYRLADVRSAEGFGERPVPGAILIPLYERRKRMDERDPDWRDIVCCHARERSAVPEETMVT